MPCFSFVWWELHLAGFALLPTFQVLVQLLLVQWIQHLLNQPFSRWEFNNLKSVLILCTSSSMYCLHWCLSNIRVFFSHFLLSGLKTHSSKHIFLQISNQRHFLEDSAAFCRWHLCYHMRSSHMQIHSCL